MTKDRSVCRKPVGSWTGTAKVKLAASARAVGDTVSFPYQMVKEGDKYVVELTHIHDGKPVDENPAPQKVSKSYRYHIVQKDGKYIVEQG